MALFTLPPWPVAFLVLRSSACPPKPWRRGAERRRKAPVRNGGTVPLGRAAAAAPVRNSTAIPGKAAFDQFDRFGKLTAGKAHGRQSSDQESHAPRGIPSQSSIHLS